MIYEQLKLPNSLGLQLDVLVEGNPNAEQVIVFAHGFGTNKNEGCDLFKDLSDKLNNDFIIVRYDMFTYGESEGKSEDFDLNTAADDLNLIIDYARNRFKLPINIVSHSLGTLVTGLAKPSNVNRIVLSAVPEDDSKFTSSKIKQRILARGGVVKTDGPSEYPRSSGENQLIGLKFWQSLETCEPVELYKALAEQSNVLIIKPLDDEIITHGYDNKYKAQLADVFKELSGDHNYSADNDRKAFINTVCNFMQN